MGSKINLQQPYSPIQPRTIQKNIHQSNNIAQVSFKDVLKEQTINDNLKFSSHCIKRMQQNNINLSSIQMDKIDKAIEKAKEKGAKESLFLMDNLALVVSIPNKTVITAVDEQRMKENIFTNIDSAVIL